MHRRPVMLNSTRWLLMTALAGLTGCSATITANPNPVAAGQPMTLSVHVSGVGNGNGQQKRAKLTQDPEGAIPDLPNSMALRYTGPGWGSGGAYSGTIEVTAPSAPGSVSITAVTKDQGNDPYVSASTSVIVE